MATLDHTSDAANLTPGTLAQLFFARVETRVGQVAFRYFPDDSPKLLEITCGEMLAQVRAVAGGLRSLGLERGDRAAILSENRPEWAVVDYGCICAGVWDVPIYATLTVPQVAYILDNSGVSAVFVSSADQMEKAVTACSQVDGSPHIVVFDAPPDLPEGVISWTDFIARGKEAMEGVTADAFRAAALEAEPDQVATILYTSGTTGNPKGVMLTHNNLWSNVQASSTHLPLREDDSTMSFLPLSHVFQRMVDYLFFSSGVTITYAHSMRTVADDFKVVRPTVAVSVPRLYEKIYNGIMEAEGLTKRVIEWARGVGGAWADEVLAGRDPGMLLRLRYRLADMVVFRRIRAAVGGRIRYFISGGAPLAPELSRFFYSVGLPILEGYGLTETSPVTNVNTIDAFKIGTVGPPVPGTEVRIAEDGEILVRGPQVMKGYYERPEATAEAIDEDGWFHTGDIGEVDEKGRLKITDRKKDIIVTAGGKNVAPQPIENRLKTNDYIEQVVMLGDRRNFCSVLVVPSFPNLGSWAKKAGIRFEDMRSLLSNRDVQEFMETQVFGSLRGLARYETPKKIGLLEKPFTIEDGTLTPTEKVKRRAVSALYQDLIDSFYDEESYDQTTFIG
ncbi:MAG: AMP-dependent synthetase/ligase [Gemmatimonadota bacterium]|nr:MAG: AMP-dependent synthetase/ligase [Gemmatimonadota bacterium]